MVSLGPPIIGNVTFFGLKEINFHGLWLPWSFNVASWFFLLVSIDFKIISGCLLVFLCLLLFSIFCQVSFMALHCYGLFHDFSRYFHGHVLFRDFSR